MTPQVLFDPEAFLGAVGPMGALLALDPGTKTIGVAISDHERSLAAPVRTMQRGKFRHDAEQLKGLVEAEKVVGIVVGLPLNMDGSAGPRAQSVRAFRRQLSEHIPLPMLFWDERLSTHAARDRLADTRSNRSRQQATIDAVAATEILADCLEHLASLTNR